MLKDKTITDFLNELKSASPTPGGGGVAALSSAEGIALIMMVANLTITVDKYSEWHEHCRKVLAQSEELLQIFVDGIDKDAEVFSRLMDACKLPAENEEDKKNRATAIADASLSAAEAPLKIMESSLKAIELCQSLLGQSNPNLVSDLHVAEHCLRTGLASAKLNVEANIPSMRPADRQIILDALNQYSHQL